MSEPETMMINEVEYVRKDSIATTEYHCKERKDGPWEIGKSYLVRTVTMIQHGRLLDVTEKELVIDQAAWIADTGRFSDFMNGRGEPSEVEPFGPGVVIVNRGAIIDAQALGGKFLTQK